MAAVPVRRSQRLAARVKVTSRGSPAPSSTEAALKPKPKPKTLASSDFRKVSFVDIGTGFGDDDNADRVRDMNEFHEYMSTLLGGEPIGHVEHERNEQGQSVTLFQLKMTSDEFGKAVMQRLRLRMEGTWMLMWPSDARDNGYLNGTSLFNHKFDVEPV